MLSFLSLLSTLLISIWTSTSAQLELASSPMQLLNQEQLAVAQTLAQQYPQSLLAYDLLGQVYHQQGQTDQATQVWERCLVHIPSHINAYLNLGLAAAQAGDFLTAIKFYQKATAINPDRADIHNHLAVAFIGLGRIQSAIEQLQISVHIRPNDSKAQYELGRAYFLANDFSQAQACYQSTIKLKPDYSPAYYGLAMTYRRLGLEQKYQQHLTKFQQLKAKEIQHKVAHIRNYDDLTQIKQKVADTCTQAGGIYNTHGDTKQAKTLWLRAIDLEAQNQTARLQLMLLYKQTGQLEAAIQVCYELIQLTPDSTKHYLNFGVLAMQLSQFELAESAFQKVISLQPEQAGGYRELAELYLRANHNLPQAQQLAQRAVALSISAPAKTAAQSYYILAWSHETQNNLKAAINALQEALRLMPADEIYQRLYHQLQQKLTSP